MSAQSVTQLVRARIPTPEGKFDLCLYANNQDGKEHLALVTGDVAGRADVLVRVHSECFTGDVLGSLRCDCGLQLEQSMKLIAEEGAGILLYLRQEGRGIGLANKLRAYNLQDKGYDTVDANLLLGHRMDERDYTTAALILKDLGVDSVRLLTNNPLKTESLLALGVAVTSRVPLPSLVNPENAAYMMTKVQRMRHMLSLDTFNTPQPANGNGDKLEKDSKLDNGHRPHQPNTAEQMEPGFLQTDEGIKSLLERAAEHRRHHRRPFVTLSYAQSMDGCIASSPGQPLALSCQRSLVLTHKLRASHDAILIGINTVLADNPRLTARLVEGRHPQPVIADSRLRFPLDSNLMQSKILSPWIATCEDADEERQRVLEDAGARVLRLPSNAQGRVHLPSLLEKLSELGIGSLMVEGGADIITSFLAERLVDQIIVTVAPVLVGGLHAVGCLSENGAVCLPRLRNLRHQQLDGDTVIWGTPYWEQG
ncbi:MAG TPA: GTP cyclohydrolase II [Pyrinomonadaceae bacterium]|jgi:3,4-dihydroxy 2-butanone 4-phosphate synthase/GTP cyclohydrolase II